MIASFHPETRVTVGEGFIPLPKIHSFSPTCGRE